MTVRDDTHVFLQTEVVPAAYFSASVPGFSASVPGTSAFRFGWVLNDLVELLYGAIRDDDQRLGEAVKDSYLYDDQSPIKVPDDWFAELSQTTVLTEQCHVA